MNEGFRNEIEQLNTFRRLLDLDSLAMMPLRVKLERRSLDFRNFDVVVSGVRMLVNQDLNGSRYDTVSTLTVQVNTPNGYPNTAIPQIQFKDRVPFHPHVFTSGGICWGTAGSPQPDLTLTDWMLSVIEMLQFNQNAILGVNVNSPANRSAMQWWQQHRNHLDRYITVIQLPRLRHWAQQANL